MSDDPLSGSMHHAHAPVSFEPAQGLDARIGARVAQLIAASSGSVCPDDAQLFARLIAARDVRGELASLGLSPPQWHGLFARHFARVAVPPLPVGVVSAAHADFVAALRTLLLMYTNVAVHADDAQALASIVAHACLRPDHLWRDLGLAGRADVSWMLTRYFPELVARNVDDLRWKKFLAQQCALSLGLQPAPAPGCPGCEDYGHCYPAERR